MAFNRLVALLLFSVSCLLAASPCIANSFSAPLEMRQPRPRSRHSNSSRGFPSVVRLVEFDKDPLSSRFPKLTRFLVRNGLRRRMPVTTRFHNVQLYGGMVAVGEYYARVKIGGQTLRVQIDTGSATLAAPVKECENCKRGDMRYSIGDSKSGIATQIGCEDAACGENTCSPFGCGSCSSSKACCAKSDNTKCAFHLNFGDGSGAKGILIRDELEWGDVKFPVTFGGIRSDSPDFERSQVDGILGMAYPTLACNPSCITPTFESLREEVTMKDMFSICITYDSGQIILGDYDPILSTQKISWVPLHLSTPPSFYSFPLVGNLKVNDHELPLPSYSKAIVDSGTTLIVFSHSTFDKFKKHLQSKYCNVPGLCGSQSWFKPAHCTRISDEDRKLLPTLKFGVQGFEITLGPSEYLINYASKGPEFWCVGIMALDAMSGGVDVIFGNTVMKKYVTIYDRENGRVGFAESDTNCGADARRTKGKPAVLPVPEVDGDDSGEGVGDVGEENGDTTSEQPPHDKPDALSSNSPGEKSHPKQKEKGSTGEGGSLAGSCGEARDCRSCSRVAGTDCVWDSSQGRCDEGEAGMLMCVIDSFAGKFVYVVGGALVAVVVVVLIAAGVYSYRKRQEAAVSGDEEEGEVEQPLAENEVDTRSAFAIEDDEPQSQ